MALDPFGTDLRLVFARGSEGADLAVGLQDLETVSGVENLVQALTLRLLVDRRPNVYIPNVFKPDSDGENAIFRIYADQTVKQVKVFQVFSRWGELVHEYYNFIPNSPAHGWNGNFNGQPLNPAVFAYYAVIELIDGQEVVYSGDVTIVR